MRLRYLEFNLKKIFLLIIIFAGMFPATARSASIEYVKLWQKQVSQGVLYDHYKLRVGGSPLHIHVVSISLAQENLDIQPILANNRLNSLETVPSMAKRTGAIVAINGSFFKREEPDPAPVGFIMIDGHTVYFSPHRHRSAFGLTADKIPLFGYPKTRGIIYLERTGKYFFLWSMNGHRQEDEILVYTPEYGPTTETNPFGREISVSRDRVVAIHDVNDGNTPIPSDGYVLSMHGNGRAYLDWFNIGDRAKLYFVVDPAWLDVHNAITGGPLLIRGDRIVLEHSVPEKLNQGFKKRIPITAVGSTADGKLLLVVADGRQKKYSVGVTYRELADFLLSLGAINAIGMDGGGSSTLWINGTTVNRPSGGAPRKVSTGIGVFFTD